MQCKGRQHLGHTVPFGFAPEDGGIAARNGGGRPRLLLRGDIGALGLSYLGRFLFVCLFNVSLKTKVVRQVPENAIMHGNFIWVYLVSWGRGDIVKECLWKK